jgi:hypothetical protein
VAVLVVALVRAVAPAEVREQAVALEQAEGAARVEGAGPVAVLVVALVRAVAPAVALEQAEGAAPVEVPEPVEVLAVALVQAEVRGAAVARAARPEQVLDPEVRVEARDQEAAPSRGPAARVAEARVGVVRRGRAARRVEARERPYGPESACTLRAGGGTSAAASV